MATQREKESRMAIVLEFPLSYSPVELERWKRVRGVSALTFDHNCTRDIKCTSACAECDKPVLFYFWKSCHPVTSSLRRQWGWEVTSGENTRKRLKKREKTFCAKLIRTERKQSFLPEKRSHWSRPVLSASFIFINGTSARREDLRLVDRTLIN